MAFQPRFPARKTPLGILKPDSDLKSKSGFPKTESGFPKTKSGFWKNKSIKP